jgi:hypothetical protein
MSVSIPRRHRGPVRKVGRRRRQETHSIENAGLRLEKGVGAKPILVDLENQLAVATKG